MILDRTTRLAIGLSAVAALMYPLVLAMDEPPWAFLVKWLALAGVGFAVWRLWPGGAGVAFFFAIVLHSTGDVLLVIERKKLFLAGVIAFLVGHIIYASVFFQGVKRPWPVRGKIALALLPIHGLVMGWILIPRLPLPLAIAVTFYIAVILTMAVFTFASEETSTAVRMGALLYLTSDTLLSWDAFVDPLPTKIPIVWLTYIGGQFLIIIGMLRRKAALT